MHIKNLANKLSITIKKKILSLKFEVFYLSKIIFSFTYNRKLLIIQRAIETCKCSEHLKYISVSLIQMRTVNSN